MPTALSAVAVADPELVMTAGADAAADAVGTTAMGRAVPGAGEVWIGAEDPPTTVAVVDTVGAAEARLVRSV